MREDGQVDRTYGYDTNGNRISVTTADGTILSTHDDQDRLLTQGDTTFTYSANGDLESRSTGGETTSYDYDSLGNLMAVTLPDGRQIEYRVDAYGRRLAKLVNGTVVRKWLYADGLLPVAELDASDHLISVFDGTFMVRDGKTYRIITDHVGSPRLVVDSTGEVVQQLTYDEWGNVTEDTNPGFQPFGFAGGLYDPDTSLVRFGARDYDPSAGRWTAKDPIRFLGGSTSLYVYCGNNPINYVDPTGLLSFWTWIQNSSYDSSGDFHISAKSGWITTWPGGTWFTDPKVTVLVEKGIPSTVVGGRTQWEFVDSHSWNFLKGDFPPILVGAGTRELDFVIPRSKLDHAFAIRLTFTAIATNSDNERQWEELVDVYRIPAPPTSPNGEPCP